MCISRALVSSFQPLDFSDLLRRKLNPFVRASLREKSSRKVSPSGRHKTQLLFEVRLDSPPLRKKTRNIPADIGFKPGIRKLFQPWDNTTFDISERLLKLLRLNITSCVS